MPCCGLHEQQHRVPVRYALAGGTFFWGVFGVGVAYGLATCWRAAGRHVLRVQAEFLRVLWLETMRSPSSMPARWSCRLSGTALRVSPRLGELVYRHPELPFVYAPLALLVALVSGGVLLARAF